jgi:hypothetical protein
MIRRIGYAGAGLCAFLLPACVSNWNPTDRFGNSNSTEPYYAYVNTGVPVSGYQQNALPGTMVVPNQFGPNRVSSARVADGPIPQVQTGGPGLVDSPIVSVSAAPEDLPKSIDQPKNSGFAFTGPSAPAGQRQPMPASPPAAITLASGQSPANDDIVIRPKWPNLGGDAPLETTSSAKPSENLILEPPPEKTTLPIQPPHAFIPAAVAPSPKSLPPLETPQPLPITTKNGEFGTSRTSAPIANPRPPIDEPSANLPSGNSNETILIKALRAFQGNRPDDAISLLRQLDPANQDVLLYLMPLMVRLGEKNMQNLPPEELAALVDRLQQATAMLKTKAALRLEHVCFCQAVRKFGDVVPFEATHEFRPEEHVYLYLEIRNFTCKLMDNIQAPLKAPGAATANSTETFSIKLATRLEICDPQGRPVVHWDLNREDHALTPTQDYYHTYRFNVPKNLPPGNYTLWVTVADQNKPDSPGIRQPMELRVGRSY